MNLQVTNKILLILVLGISLGSCRSSDRQLVERGEENSFNQKPQVAKYLFLQVVQSRSTPDRIRFDALRGLADVTLNQLYEYAAGVKTLESIVSEYYSNPEYTQDVLNARLQASEVMRLKMEDPQRAIDLLLPALVSENDDRLYLELGHNYLALRDYENSLVYFQKAWELGRLKKDCKLLKNLQIKIVQTFSLAKHYDLALKWIDIELMPDCLPDRYALELERAHSLELTGEVTRAVEVYERLAKENPKNSSAHFLLEGIKRRQREKALR